MFAKFNEILMLFQDIIKEKPKRRGQKDGRTDGKRENSIPHKHSLRGGGGIIRNHNLYQWKGLLFVYISAEGFD